MQPVLSSRRISAVLHTGPARGEELVTWELELACGHRTHSEVRYSDADGPEDAGPHLAPRNHMCPYGCVGPDPMEVEGLPLWPWLVMAAAMAGVLLWMVWR